jgi:hypothetical protein
MEGNSSPAAIIFLCQSNAFLIFAYRYCDTNGAMQLEPSKELVICDHRIAKTSFLTAALTNDVTDFMLTSRLDCINDNRRVATAADNRNDQAYLQKVYQITS